MTLGQLADYINRNVSITSPKVNEKEQDPAVITSEKVAGSWRNWTFNFKRENSMKKLLIFCLIQFILGLNVSLQL